MRKQLVIICSGLALVSWGLQSQTSSSGGGATTSAGSAAGQGAQPNPSLPPGLQRRDQPPPGLQRQDQLPPGLNRGFPGALGGTNQVPRFPPGNPVLTNVPPPGLLPPTGFTNALAGTNIPPYTLDRAFTSADQALLIQLRQQLQPVFTSPQLSGLPIGFVVRDGTVTLVGSVPDVEAKRNILARVRQVRGVVAIQDQLVVGQNRNNSALGGTGQLGGQGTGGWAGGVVVPGQPNTQGQPNMQGLPTESGQPIIVPQGQLTNSPGQPRLNNP